MNKDLFISQLEKTLELDEGTLRDDQEVRRLEHWDSLKLLEILALADEECNAQLDADQLAKCVTVGDIIRLVEDAAK